MDLLVMSPRRGRLPHSHSQLSLPLYEMRVRIADQNHNNKNNIDRHQQISTKCLKMSEEIYRRQHTNTNTNGNSSINEECSTIPYNQGGRLKFFKDGKFILELERARDGEKVSWVSVPRKTYWPPQVNTVPTTTYKQESSTSLSVSDDNSSLQSSPWQRDHSWKQAIPRKNLSREMSFYYWCPKKISSNIKRRLNPNSATTFRRRKLIISSASVVNFQHLETKCNMNMNSIGKAGSKKCRKKSTSLMSIVQCLAERSIAPRTSPLDTTLVSVSPRKRFLREMEKDKLIINDACQKRSRNKTIPPHTPPSAAASPASSSTNTTATTNSISSSNCGGGSASPPTSTNGIEDNNRMHNNNKNCSSYSITSLLADDRNKSPSHFTQPPQSTNYAPPTSRSIEDPWYSESVDRLRSIELSQVDKRGSSLSSYPPPYHHHHHHFIPPYMYQYPFYPSNMYSRNYIVPTSSYQLVAPLSSVHLRNPNPNPNPPSCSWTETPRTIKNDEEEQEETVEDEITDMPLNLSKHAS